MKKALDYASAEKYYLGKDRSAAKVGLLNRTQELLDRLLRVCGAYDVFYHGSSPSITYWRGCTGGSGLSLGALAPDPISDLTVGGVRRGRFIRKPDVDCWEGLLYGFDADKRLRIVKHGSNQNLSQITFVSYQGMQTAGIRYNVRLKEPEAIFVCDYGDSKRILRYSTMYILFNNLAPERSQVVELYDAKYDYEDDLLTTADERSVFYLEPPVPFITDGEPGNSSEERCRMKRRIYQFQIDENKYYVSWRCKDYDGDTEIIDSRNDTFVPIRKHSRAHSTLRFIEE